MHHDEYGKKGCRLDYTGAERGKGMVYGSLLDSDISVLKRLQRSYS